MKKAGGQCQDRQPHHAAARGDGDGVAETNRNSSPASTRPSAWPSRRPPLHRQHRRRRQRALQAGIRRSTATPMKLTDLPAGTRNHHWTKSLIASKDGSKLYATVGSNSASAENGSTRKKAAPRSGRSMSPPEQETNSSPPACAIPTAWAGNRRPARSGRRSTSATNSATTVPDYITSVKDGGFYGWPWSYYGQTVDTR